MDPEYSMELLSHTVCYNKSDKVSQIIKTWYFINEKNHYCSLINVKSTLNAARVCCIYLGVSKNPSKEEWPERPFENKYYYKDLDENSNEIINLAEETQLKKIMILIKKSNTNLNNAYKKVDIIKNIIGDYTYFHGYDIGWYIPNYLKINIDLYKDIITIESMLEQSTLPANASRVKGSSVKGKQRKLNNKTLSVFLDKNKKTILMIKNLQKKRVNATGHPTAEDCAKTQKAKIENLEGSEPKDVINFDPYHKLKSTRIKLNSCKNIPLTTLALAGKVLFIKRSKQKRYESQANKPFPINYSWEN